MKYCVLILLALLTHPIGLAAQSFDLNVRPLLEKFCIECHGGKKVKGKVDFKKMRTEADLSAAFETWETAIELLHDERCRRMPRGNRPPPIWT